MRQLAGLLQRHGKAAWIAPLYVFLRVLYDAVNAWSAGEFAYSKGVTVGPTVVSSLLGILFSPTFELLILLIGFGWLYLAKRLDDEDNAQRIRALEGENARLKDDRATLEILFEPRPPYLAGVMERATDGTDRIAQLLVVRIGMLNSSSRRADNVQASLETMRPLPMLTGRPLGLFPSSMDADSEGNELPFSLNPRERRFLDVARTHPGPPSGNAWWLVLGNANTNPTGWLCRLETERDYHLTIRVTAANAEPAERTFKLRHRADGALEFSPAEVAAVPH